MGLGKGICNEHLHRIVPKSDSFVQSVITHHIVVMNVDLTWMSQAKMATNKVINNSFLSILASILLAAYI